MEDGLLICELDIICDLEKYFSNFFLAKSYEKA